MYVVTSNVIINLNRWTIASFWYELNWKLNANTKKKKQSRSHLYFRVAHSLIKLIVSLSYYFTFQNCIFQLKLHSFNWHSCSSQCHKDIPGILFKLSILTEWEINKESEKDKEKTKRFILSLRYLRNKTIIFVNVAENLQTKVNCFWKKIMQLSWCFDKFSCKI